MSDTILEGEKKR